MDYSKFQTTPAIPEASSMIETFRAIGYNIQTAIADIVDNSISADAKNIWINFDWKGQDTWLSIKDDGSGMNSSELIQALRPGSRNPLEDRNIKDLGRFGLGLKTASFSQCRKLTVISKKKEYDMSYWTWDLDFVKITGKWELIRFIPDEELLAKLSLMDSGTIVLWNDIDRLVRDFEASDSKALDKFLETMEKVKKHLAMVFHRFLESGKIKIWFQERPIAPWNPFLTSVTSTQLFPEEFIDEGNIRIKGFVLPHKSKLTEDQFREAEGLKGWNEQQGFYIYRNERLLLAGDWLGMFRKEEHYKLARIQIDIPNTLDAVWQIDIKKSIARPPSMLRDQLKAYASKVRTRAVEVYRHKGRTIQKLPGQQFVPLWLEHKRGDKWHYKINREHPLIEQTKEEVCTNPEKAIEVLLRFIEETIPTKSIYIKEAEESEAQGKPFEKTDHEALKNLMRQMYESLLQKGKSQENAKAIILNLEPFNLFPHYIESIL